MKKFTLSVIIFTILFSLSVLALSAPQIIGDGDIRAKEPVGLRVKAVVSGQTAIDTGVFEYGFIVTRKVFLDAKGLTVDDFTLNCGVPYTKGISKGIVDGEKVDIFFDRNDEEVFFSCIIHGIDEAFYTDELVVRTYMISDSTCDYGNCFVTSLYDTAKSIYYNDERFDGLSDDFRRTIFCMVAGVENLKEHRVKFLLDGEAYNEQVVFENKYAVLPKVPEKEGYEFLGWSETDGGKVVDVSLVQIAKQTDFYAVFRRIEHTVTFIAEEKTHDVQSVWYNESALLPVSPEKEGYNFIGWADEKGVIVYPENIIVTCDRTFHAVFEKKSYKVNFFLDDVGYDLQNVKYEEKAVLPASPEKEGYTFIGWSESRDGDIVNVENVIITSDKAFYAVFEEIWYSVAFVYEGKEISSQTIRHKEKASLPENPEKEGYNFLGWSEIDGGETVDAASLSITHNTVFYAVFEIKKYSVTFMVDGEVYSDSEISHGEYVSAPENPAMAYRMIFHGWSLSDENDSSLVVEVGDIVVTEPMTFHAVIIENPNSEEFIEKLTRGYNQITSIKRLTGIIKTTVNTIAECMAYVIEDVNKGILATREYVRLTEPYRSIIDGVKHTVTEEMDAATRSAFVNTLTNPKNIDEDVQDFLCEYFDIDMTQIK